MHHSLLFLRYFFIAVKTLAPIWGVLAVIITLLGFIISIIERIGIVEGIYFAWITGTTVGYGDIVPTRHLTRFLSVIIGIIGIVNTGIIVTIAVNAGKRVTEQTDLLTAIKRQMTK